VRACAIAKYKILRDVSQRESAVRRSNPSRRSSTCALGSIRALITLKTVCLSGLGGWCLKRAVGPAKDANTTQTRSHHSLEGPDEPKARGSHRAPQFRRKQHCMVHSSDDTISHGRKGESIRYLKKKSRQGDCCSRRSEAMAGVEPGGHNTICGMISAPNRNLYPSSPK
jgi:hypothetical protein